jgi:hypothetical protein
VTLPPPLDPARHDRAEHTVAGAPDLPHPVLAWRTWRVGRRAQRRSELIAPLAGVLWPPKQPMVASCGSRSHSPPGDGCGCGLYAAADPGTLDWGPSELEVLGVVALWGRIVEGTRGWRASHAYPHLLVTGPGIPGEQRAALARRYGVPVHRSEVPPRDLARLLSAAPEHADVLRHGAHAEVEALLAVEMPEWVRRWEARSAEPAVAAPPPRSGLRLFRRRFPRG